MLYRLLARPLRPRPPGSRDLHSTAWLGLVVVMALAGGLLSGSQLGAELIAPNAPVAGQSQLDHAHQWWQTMLNIPLAVNPITDPTGAEALRGQVGSVLYLAGSFGGATNRTVTVQPGTTLFLPLINSLGDNTALIATPQPPPTTFTAQELLDLFGMPPANVQNLFLEIDGVPVGTTASLLNHRQVTDPNNPFTNVINSPQNAYVDFGYDVTLGTGDPFDPASYPASIFPTVVDGYWVAISPFAPGSTHTIRFGADVGFTQDNTFTIITANVVPEPASILTWGVLIAGVAVCGWYRKRNGKSTG